MLKLENIKFWYSNILDLFSNVNFSINVWEIIWLYWPSWIWKTTLLKIIWWLIKPTNWNVFYNWKYVFDMDYSQLSKYRNQDIGFIFQNFNLLEDFKVEENLMLPFTISDKSDIEFDAKWYDFLLNYFEIKKLIWKSISNISWWEKQRVSIIKALIHKPKVLLMDEPTTYLNIELTNKFFDLVKNYSKENICIFVSHDEITKEYFWLEKTYSYWEILVYLNKMPPKYL